MWDQSTFHYCMVRGAYECRQESFQKLQYTVQYGEELILNLVMKTYIPRKILWNLRVNIFEKIWIALENIQEDAVGSKFQSNTDDRYKLVNHGVNAK